AAHAFVIVLAAALPFAPAATAQASKGDAALTDVDRKVLAELTEVRETPRAVFHWRAADVDAKALDADVAADLAALASLEKTLQMSYRGRVHFFLSRDVDTMKQLTGAGGGTVAFSTGTVSIHQAHDFRGVHELVHLFALQFERAPDTSGPDLFATE